MPSAEEQAAARHHLIDMLPLESYYSAAMFEQDALRLLRQHLFRQCDTAIVCGGSMMYVDALCNGIDQLPDVPPALRAELALRHREEGDAWLLDLLLRLDPDYFNKVDRNNIKRVFHAVEISLTAGKPYSSMLTGQKKEREFSIEKYYIDLPRETLFSRINRRVDTMVANGLEEEARSVYHLRRLNSLNTVGLKEMFAMFDGTMTRSVAIERIKKNTRVFAKKQLTWLRRSADAIPVDPARPDTIPSP